MFAALTVPRLIEAVAAAPAEHNLPATPSWRSPDHVAPQDLPLARAAQKVLASMQAVLGKTAEACERKMAEYDSRVGRSSAVEGEAQRHFALMNASEVVVPRFVRELREPPELERFRPRAVRVELDGVGELRYGESGEEEGNRGEKASGGEGREVETQEQGARDAKMAGKSVKD